MKDGLLESMASQWITLPPKIERMALGPIRFESDPYSEVQALLAPVKIFSERCGDACIGRISFRPWWGAHPLKRMRP